jgi:phosphoribosyl 1,2-cyclic phosphodiesterase
MKNNDTRILFLGTRGSIPVSGAEYIKYGGATSCVLVQMGGETILLDAGSGLMDATRLLADVRGRINILITHPHIDHIIGLPCFPLLYDKSKSFTIMTESRHGMGAQEQISTLMAQPIWPVSPNIFLADISYVNISHTSFQIGEVKVSTMISNHPGGCTLYRLTHGEHSIAYCTDFEHGGEYSANIVRFAEGVSLLIYDAHFSGDEYPAKQGWGHSTWEEAVRIANECGAKRLAITHHNPSRTDTQLEAAESALLKGYPAYFFAKSGLEITL